MSVPSPAPPSTIDNARRKAALAGVLFGTAVGDSVGLPMEGLSALRQKRLFPMPLRQRLIGSFGMLSDDTEHTLMVANSLLTFPINPAAFQRDLARRLRWWLAALPAGVGFATLRAIMKLWCGVSPSRSGVFSAGNGPAMRCALLGVYFAHDKTRRTQFVTASTEITHRDPKARIAALAVAETAAWMSEHSDDTAQLMADLAPRGTDAEWQDLMISMSESMARGDAVSVFAERIGAKNGVSGYAYRTVPVAIYAAWLHRENFEAALSEAIVCGGDTDTVAAIVGGLVGARVGLAGIPQQWHTRILEYPRSRGFIRRVADKLGQQMENGDSLGPVRGFWPAIPLRNLAFLAVVLGHGFRRLFPPY